MTISSEDIELADKFYNILNTGYYCDSKSVTDLFNKLTVRMWTIPIAQPV